MSDLLLILSLSTLLIFVALAINSVRRNKAALQSEDAPVSSLATDGPGPSPLAPPSVQRH